MAKKNFWNRIGLPCFQDNIHLLEELHKQQCQITRLEQAYTELFQQLLNTEKRLADTVKIAEKQSQTVFSATAQNLIQQSTDIAKHLVDVKHDILIADQRSKQAQDNLLNQIEATEKVLLKGNDEVKQAFVNSSMAEQMKKISTELIETDRTVHLSIEALDEKARYLEETLSSLNMEINSVNTTVDSLNDIESDQNELLRMLLVNFLSDSINQMMDISKIDEAMSK